MVVVLSEDSFVDPNTINGRELRATAEAARMFGCRIFPIPTDFEVCETAENALAYLPEYEPTVQISSWSWPDFCSMPLRSRSTMRTIIAR
jgi:hypothetical protein